MPVGKKALQNKWVYRLKEEEGGKKIFKARLVVKGFAHKKGINFDEIFSPVVKMTSICTILSIVATEDLHLEHLDFKTTLLHCDLDEEIYMAQPQRFGVKGKENLVYRLKEVDGDKKIFKAKLPVKGFAQKKGIDFDDIFSLVVKMTYVRTILNIVATEDFYLL